MGLHHNTRSELLLFDNCLLAHVALWDIKVNFIFLCDPKKKNWLSQFLLNVVFFLMSLPV